MRALLIVLDLPGINSVATWAGDRLPALDSLGLWKTVAGDMFHPRSQRVHGCWGRTKFRSGRDDATTLLWETCGVLLEQPLPTFERIPQDLVRGIEKSAGVQFIGNRAASGRAMLEEFGPEHLQTGKPILYTSRDSVLQIAAHEDAVPLPKLYEICRVARRHADHRRIGRVIARPFRGKPGAFERTAARREFAMPPPRTVLNALAEAGFAVAGIGDIGDIFAGSGVTRSYPAALQTEGMQTIERMWNGDDDGLIFAHLQNRGTEENSADESTAGRRLLQEFDLWLRRFELQIEQDDLLLIAMVDLGNPPTPTPETGLHEWPLLMSHGQRTGPLGTRRTAADVAATLAEYFALRRWPAGESFLHAPAVRTQSSPA